MLTFIYKHELDLLGQVWIFLRIQANMFPESVRQYASIAMLTVMIKHRHDLLGEVRILWGMIASQSHHASDKKKKAEMKVESMLQDAEDLAYLLKIEGATELFAQVSLTLVSDCACMHFVCASPQHRMCCRASYIL